MPPGLANEPTTPGVPAEPTGAETTVAEPSGDAVEVRPESAVTGTTGSDVSRETAPPVDPEPTTSSPETLLVKAPADPLPVAPSGLDVSRETVDSTAPVSAPVSEQSPGGAATETAEAADVSRETEPAAALQEATEPVAPSTDLPAAAAAGLAAPDVSRETEAPVAATGSLSPSPLASSDGLPTVSRETPAAPYEPAPDTGWPRPSSCRVIAVANQKGGVGKTTSTVNVGAALAMHGLRVLVIDLDPQGNASTALSVDHREGQPSVYDVLVESVPIMEIAQPVEAFPLLFCVPATIDVAGAEVELVSLVARETRLRKALAPVLDQFDYVFIDCPPSLGLLTINAFVAAQEVMIPIQCEFYALEGLSQLLRNIELIRSHLNENLAISTILLTMYDARTKLSDQVANEVRSHFGDKVVESVIPRSVRISEAPGFGQTVVTFDPASRGAKAYVAAANEIAVRSSAVGPAAG